MVGGGDHFHLKLWVKATALDRNRRFSVDIENCRFPSDIKTSVYFSVAAKKLDW